MKIETKLENNDKNKTKNIKQPNNIKNINNNKKYIKFGDITTLEYDKLHRTKCFCNSDYWCVVCDGDFDDFFN